MTTPIQKIQNMTAQARSINAEFVGSLMSLSVSIDDSTPLSVNRIRNAILANPNIPEDWAPEGLNQFSIYVRTVNELDRTRLSSFRIPFDIEDNFDLNEFGGYEVKKLKHKGDEEIPAVHRVFYRHKIKTNDPDIAGRDLAFPHSVKVILHRVSGSKETDATGESVFQIKMDNDECPDEFVHLYTPFLTTLYELFHERCDGVFTGAQVRDLLMDVIVKRVGSFSINKGLYFVDADKVSPVMSLVEVLNSLDPGINVVLAPVLRFDNDAMNAGFDSLKTNLSSAILKSAAQFKSELENLRDKDSDTRASTWEKRFAEYRDLEQRVKDYSANAIISADILTDTLAEIKTIFAEVI